jgi:hypothetical protein
MRMHVEVKETRAKTIGMILACIPLVAVTLVILGAMLYVIGHVAWSTLSDPAASVNGLFDSLRGLVCGGCDESEF